MCNIWCYFRILLFNLGSKLQLQLNFQNKCLVVRINTDYTNTFFKKWVLNINSFFTHFITHKFPVQGLNFNNQRLTVGRETNQCKSIRQFSYTIPACVQNLMCFIPTVINLLLSKGFHFTTNILSLWPLKVEKIYQMYLQTKHISFKLIFVSCDLSSLHFTFIQ